jgi:hypothetical protein
VVRGSSLTSYPFDELIPSEAGTGLSNGGSFLSSGRVSLSLSLSLSLLARSTADPVVEFMIENGSSLEMANNGIEK